MQTLTEVTLKMAAAKAAADERIVRALLGRWVSEFEPSICYRNGEVIGLAVADDPTGAIVVPTIDLRGVVRLMADMVANTVSSDTK